MQGIKRRVVYVGLYETIAVIVTSIGMLAFAENGLSDSVPLAVAMSTVAVLWNLMFNWIFEKWESRQKTRGRGAARRIAHAIGFEGGLTFMLVPLIAWWLDIALFKALAASLSMLVFFMIYTFVFTWGFDRIFGLPASASPSLSPGTGEPSWQAKG